MKWILVLLRILGLLILNVNVQIASAQPLPIRFQHLSVEQGLSHNEVTSITQDRYGLMWIGTSDGLNRFDGYNVEIYRNEPGNKNSIPNNLVRCVFADSHGGVWIGTTKGLAYFNNYSNSFQSFFQNSKDENSLPSSWINVINEDAHGILWIGTNAGLCSFDVKNKHFQQFLQNENSNSISNNDIRDIKFSSDGAMWIATANGLNRLDPSTMRFTSFFHDPLDSSTLSGNNLAKIAIDKNGKLWAIFQGNLHLDCFNTKTNRCRRFLNFTKKQSHISANYLRSVYLLTEMDGFG